MNGVRSNRILGTAIFSICFITLVFALNIEMEGRKEARRIRKWDEVRIIDIRVPSLNNPEVVIFSKTFNKQIILNMDFSWRQVIENFKVGEEIKISYKEDHGKIEYDMEHLWGK